MNLKKLVLSVLPAALLAACGGGGGGGGGGDSSWLSFDRNPVQVTMSEGETPKVNLRGTASSEPDVSIQVGVFADANLFDPNTLGYFEDGYSATFHGRLRPGLAVGTHTGYIEVRVCEDNPNQCSVPYGGSPWRVTVNVQVLPDPGNPTSPANGDFSAGMNNWATSAWGGGIGSSAVTGGELHTTISSGGPDTWNVQVNYTGGINLEAGRTYRLSFDARADAPRGIEAYVAEGSDRDGDGYGSIYTQSMDYSLGTTMQTFHRDFAMTETDRAADLRFMLGGSTTGVYLDNVTVTDITL